MRPSIIVTLFACAALGGCASSQHPPQDAPSASAQPASAAQLPDPGAPTEYPKIFWMCTMYQLPADTRLGPDATVERGPPAGKTSMVIPAAEIDRVFASIRACEGARFLAAPALVTQPGQIARVESIDRDKAGRSIGPGDLELSGTIDERGLSIQYFVTVSKGAGHGTPPSHIDAGRAVVHLCSGNRSTDPKTLLILRPSIIRDASEMPVQREVAPPQR